MALHLYNTLTREIQPFETIAPQRVKMYCCGVTVYDYCHLGHARTCLVWDVTRRYLQWLGYQVYYVQNFTDIDDKILRRAHQEGTTMEAVAERFIAAYFTDMARLGVSNADAYPRATHYLDGIKRLVAQLEAKGFAYASDGDVYYSVQKFTSYGKLSGRRLEDLQAGERNTTEALKQDTYDFALWKGAKPGEPAWDSPWGRGRPGWHIECSAMVKEALGETIDIHVGGADLVFPHHENEIAQSEAATGKPLANYWLHNGMVMVNGEKMSKSLGNFITIRDLLDRPVDPMAVRLFILQTQYRKPIDFNDQAIETATNGWKTLRKALLFGSEYGPRLGFAASSVQISNTYTEQFRRAVDDDLNFPAGLAVVFELAKELRRDRNLLIHEGQAATPIPVLAEKWQTLAQLAEVLGFKANPVAPDQPLNQLSDEAIQQAVSDRQAARQAKNFQQADQIRQYLTSQGVTIIDSPDGTTRWHRN